MRRVVVTGLGALTPLGIGVRQTWSRLLNGDSGVTSIRSRGPQYEKLDCQVAGTLPPGSDAHLRGLLSRDDERRMATFMQYAAVTTDEALQDANWYPEDPKDQEMTGVCLGSGIGAFEDVYNTCLAFAEHGAKKVSPHFVPRLLINLAAGHISMKYGFKGPNHAVSTACTTGAHSIGDAARFIAFGDADVMVAGGAEACIHPLAITGFQRSRSLAISSNGSPERASRPFNRDRDGFVMGEGAGIMVLEELQHALARKARIYAELKSYATTSDAHHITHPPPSGSGAFRAMRCALVSAQLPPSSVSYINAHATSTPLGDGAENAAISSFMLGEDGLTNPSDVCVSSIKGALGHLLGAAGAVEAVASVMAIIDGAVPPTINLNDIDIEEFKFNYVPIEKQERKVDVVLTNSFGFGGTNACLCFTRYEG